MADLLIGTRLQQIEQALLQQISFALKRRRPPAATPAALRILPSLSASSPLFEELTLIIVTSLSRLFYWSQFSTATDNGTTVIKPGDAGTSGRWLRAESSLLYQGNPVTGIATGILKEVILHVGDFSDEVLRARIFAKSPCVAIHFDDETFRALSQIPGSLYDYRVRFEIWSCAQNFRDKFEANVGPELAAEVADDPGVMRIHGAVSQFLAGSTLGIDSITHTEILTGRLDRSEVAERIFVMALEIEVRGSVDNPDAPQELTAVSEIDAQRYTSQAPAGGELDLDNCVTSGLSVPLGGFVMTIAAGTAVIDGTTVVVNALAHTFSASTSTYRDLKPDGTWTLTEVAAGQNVPDPAAGSLRVGLTTTDAAGVAADAFLCSVYIPSETPDVIDL